MTRRSYLLTAAGALAAQTSRRGSVAFHYAARFTEADLEWYTRFRILVTGAILPPEQNRALQARGTRLISYEWTSAYYPGDASSASPQWQETMNARREWLLDREPVGGGAAEPGRRALWYDFANTGLCRARAAHLAAAVRSSGYAGVFLDTLGFEQLPTELQAAFQARHPGVDYNSAQAAFLAELRRQMGSGSILFLNQGYRRANLFLPYANFDLTESYFTAIVNGRTLFRQWSPRDPWQGVRTPVEELVIPAARKFPNVRFVHLGYAAGTGEEIRRAIRYNYAAAKLWNHESYLVTQNSKLEEDDIYFKQPGRALSRRYESSELEGAAWREFETATIAINSGPAPVIAGSARHVLNDPPQGYYFPRP